MTFFNRSDIIIPVAEMQRRFGSIAQLGEHLPYKQRVIGSSPIVPTTLWSGSSVGYNASLSRWRSCVRAPFGSQLYASVSQSVEQGTENPCVGGSIPPRGTTIYASAGVAQSVEQLTCNQ